jgi:hypothetical protein
MVSRANISTRGGFLLGILLLSISVLTGCDSAPFLDRSVTLYDLTRRPDDFVGHDVEVVGVYLDKAPGDASSHITILLPGVDTSGGKDTQPIYAGENAAGYPVMGAVWLDGSLPPLDSSLRRSTDASWGVVDVSGRFEKGNFGPGGSYLYRLVARDARPLQQRDWEAAVVLERKPLREGKVSLFDLADSPAQFAGKSVTTQGYYFWSQATSGLLVEKIDRERGEVVRSISTGTNPRPGGRIIVLEGFPPELSSQLNFGPDISYLWGLVEVTGTFETGGSWGASGVYHQRLTISNGEVKVLGK